MYEDADYVASKKAGGSTTLKRVFFFTYPVVAYKVKIHQMFGDDVIALRVEFLGTDVISQEGPFQGGTVDKSRKISCYFYCFSIVIVIVIVIVVVISRTGVGADK